MNPTLTCGCGRTFAVVLGATMKRDGQGRLISQCGDCWYTEDLRHAINGALKGVATRMIRG